MSKPKKKFEPPGYDDHDVLVGDPQFIQELDISNGTKCRYDKDPAMAALGWPPPMKIKERNYRSRRMIEAFKAAMLKRAIEERRKLMERSSEEAA
jgi:hypothetical protein